MVRLKEEFVQKVNAVIPLQGLHVLEVGCGQGGRSVTLAEKVRNLVGVDPNPESIAEAQKLHARPNISYHIAAAEKLPFEKQHFDAVFFTLSLHHVPPEFMSQAVDEAVRVTKPGGWIIFLEAGNHGTFLQTEEKFGAGDGDERRVKALAYAAMLNQDRMNEVAEIWDETIFQFDSLEDFLEYMGPKGDIDGLKVFLEQHKFILSAERRINIFQVT